MDTFDINLLNQTLTIQPDEDGSFTVYEGSKFIAKLIPELNDYGINDWSSSDQIPKDYAQQIGELIEEYLM